MPEGSLGGRKGKPQGRLHPVFSDLLKDFQDKATSLVESMQAKSQRQWQVPADFKGNLLDVDNLHEPSFNRDAINTNYDELTQTPTNAGTNGDVIALKLQLDYVAQAEREWRYRNASLSRCFIHAHGRRYGHGKGRVLKAIREEAERALASGGATPSGGTVGAAAAAAAAVGNVVAAAAAALATAVSGDN